MDYDDVDPMAVLQLNLLSLGYTLTPERVALIRRLDPRPLPFFGVYAVEEGDVAGQVAVYRLPVITSDGPEDVGGVCAVCTHPAFSGRGFASKLLDEAHNRMRAVGLRFSTLGTARYRLAHRLYQSQGYEDVFIPGSTLARVEDVRCDRSLRTERGELANLGLTDSLFHRVAAGRLGFARRHAGFIPALVEMGDLSPDSVWLIWDGEILVGYALTSVSESVLHVNSLLLAEDVDAASAVSAIARRSGCSYVQVRVDHTSVSDSLRQAGFPPVRPSWGTFMVKPLVSDVSTGDARRLFGIGSQRFMISYIDVT